MSILTTAIRATVIAALLFAGDVSADDEPAEIELRPSAFDPVLAQTGEGAADDMLSLSDYDSLSLPG